MLEHVLVHTIDVIRIYCRLRDPPPKTRNFRFFSPRDIGVVLGQWHDRGKKSWPKPNVFYFHPRDLFCMSKHSGRSKSLFNTEIFTFQNTSEAHFAQAHIFLSSHELRWSRSRRPNIILRNRLGNIKQSIETCSGVIFGKRTAFFKWFNTHWRQKSRQKMIKNITLNFFQPSRSQRLKIRFQWLAPQIKANMPPVIPAESHSVPDCLTQRNEQAASVRYSWIIDFFGHIWLKYQNDHNFFLPRWKNLKRFVPS